MTSLAVSSAHKKGHRLCSGALQLPCSGGVICSRLGRLKGFPDVSCLSPHRLPRPACLQEHQCSTHTVAFLSRDTATNCKRSSSASSIMPGTVHKRLFLPGNCTPRVLLLAQSCSETGAPQAGRVASDHDLSPGPAPSTDITNYTSEVTESTPADASATNPCQPPFNTPVCRRHFVAAVQ